MKEIIGAAVVIPLFAMLAWLKYLMATDERTWASAWHWLGVGIFGFSAFLSLCCLVMFCIYRVMGWPL